MYGNVNASLAGPLWVLQQFYHPSGTLMVVVTSDVIVGVVSSQTRNVIHVHALKLGWMMGHCVLLFISQQLNIVLTEKDSC